MLKSEPKMKKDLILEGAIVAFAKKGYTMATIDDVAAEASKIAGQNINKSLTYFYYRNKLDLLLSILVSFWERLNIIVNRGIVKIDDPLDKLKTILGIITEILTDNLYLAKVLLESLPLQQDIDEEELRTKRIRIKEENEAFFSTLVLVIKQGQDKNFDKTLRPELVCQILYGSFEMLTYGLFLKLHKNKKNNNYNKKEAIKAMEHLFTKFVME